MAEETISKNFIQIIIEADLQSGKNGDKVQTRFPPEPNGYLHIGHAKSICLNFGLAKQYNGKCNLRFDDTNPSKEEQEYVDSIQNDVQWLGYNWEDRLFYASDYFEKLYKYAEDLIQANKAYVCDLSNEEIRQYRGTLTAPGKDSPYRNRSIEENLDLFRRMRAGEFPDGSRVLRAKIDMASPNINMRDPVIYRIMHAEHHRTGNKWSLYPMYDYTHCISDALEGVTHSICTLEFEDHRPLYDWVLDQLDVSCHPQQIEFARLNLTYTVLSKRKLLQLVNEKHVSGWDDPRMPTIAGIRRRGYTAASIRRFCDMIGVSKADNFVDIAMLEFAVREDLNQIAERRMVVIKPIKLIIDNYPADKEEMLEADNLPDNPTKRQVPFSRELFIDADDFREVPPPKYHRLTMGMEVRLLHAYYVTCTSIDKDEKGEITAIHCTHDPETRGGWSQSGRKVKGTIHWVSAKHAKKCEVRLYNHLFTKENPEEVPEGQTFLDNINPQSLEIIPDAMMEPSLEAAFKQTNEFARFQFVRQGYFVPDKDGTLDKPVFNRTVTLKDTWAKIEKKG